MTPRAATALNPIELRLSGGMLALNRLIMTFQNKRMPVAGLTVGRDAEGMRATIVLDCPPETARRYAALLSSLEDVEGLDLSGDTIEVALLETKVEGWRESAARGDRSPRGGRYGRGVRRSERMEAWLGTLEVEDIVRLGPVARPGDGG